MILLILLTLVVAQVKDGDCTFIDTLLKREYQLEKPIVILLYYKYGAIYQYIKNDYQLIANNFQYKYEFYQVDLAQYQYECIIGIFDHQQVPLGIFVNKQYEYHAEIVRKADLILNVIKDNIQVQFLPLPQYDQYRKISILLKGNLFQQILQAIIGGSLILFLIWLRFNIYKDKPILKKE